MQHVADNVDHDICTIDGLNTFHGMGIIATVTPKLTIRNHVPKIIVSTKDIIGVSNIDIHIFRQKGGPSDWLKYEKLPNLSLTNNAVMSLFWNSTWLLKPCKPLWNGFMQTVQNGDYPGQSSVILMPMIDMKATDASCIYSTMYFVVNQANKYNQSPILTFDQPLFQKATDIISNEFASSPLKTLVL